MKETKYRLLKKGVIVGGEKKDNLSWQGEGKSAQGGRDWVACRLIRRVQ